jgi:predicted KAP-like P-loop ATPase
VGFGKTSLLNMVVERLRDDPPFPVVEFNPWLFSGTEQLVASFFEEMSAQLRLEKGRLAGIADELEAYGEALSPLRFVPVVGPWLDRVGSGGAALGRLLGRRARSRSSVSALRRDIEQKLRALNHPLVVLVDDLDRLTTSEIRDVFKLVRLTANFPNVVYLLAFDRQRVEAALGDDGMDGRAYLEKILQVAYEVPAIPDEMLRRVFLENLQATLDALETGPFQEALWPDVLVECIWPFVNNLRDVKRYLAALPLTVRQLGTQVAIVDVLAAEALRMFLPETHALLATSATALTATRDPGYGRHDDESNRQLVADFVESGGKHREVVRAFCARLFPASGGTSVAQSMGRIGCTDGHASAGSLTPMY